MTYKERAEMMNLRQRVEAQREEIRKLQEKLDELKEADKPEAGTDDDNDQDEGRP